MTTKKNLTIPATEFKARCLELMDRVSKSGIQITIAKDQTRTGHRLLKPQTATIGVNKPRRRG